MIHPLAEVFPNLSEEQCEQLKSSVGQFGFISPIITYEDCILDGRHRVKVFGEIEGMIPPEYKEYEGYQPVSYLIAVNDVLNRYNVDQRAMIAVALMDLRIEVAKQNVDYSVLMDYPPDMRSAAKKLNVRMSHIKSADMVNLYCIPKISESVRDGVVTLSDAEKICSEPQSDQEEFYKMLMGGKVATLQSGRNMFHMKQLSDNPPELPTGKYHIIVIDPPWEMNKIKRDVAPNQTDMDYPTMSVDKIKQLPVMDNAADDCWVFMWTTQRYIWEGRDILKSWGFEPMGWFFTWVKSSGFQPTSNIPRMNCEYVLVGKRGSPVFTSKKGLKMGFNARTTGHSRKPEEFYKMIRNSTIEPRLEMFNRRSIDGFDSWGNEEGKEDTDPVMEQFEFMD